MNLRESSRAETTRKGLGLGLGPYVTMANQIERANPREQNFFDFETNKQTRRRKKARAKSERQKFSRNMQGDDKFVHDNSLQ